MNYYYPYYSYNIPFSGINTFSRNSGLISRLFGNINISNILNGTQRTLNIVNQTIPLIKQAQPIIKNAKTMFKVMNEFKKVDTPTSASTNSNEKKENVEYINDNNPTFFA